MREITVFQNPKELLDAFSKTRAKGVPPAPSIPDWIGLGVNGNSLYFYGDGSDAYQIEGFTYQDLVDSCLSSCGITINKEVIREQKD